MKLNAKVLYLDKVTAEMEKAALAATPEGIDLLFTEPRSAEARKGTFEEAEYYLVTYFGVPAEVIDRGSSLKMIQRTGAGYDHVDVEYAKSKNIPVALAMGSNATSVAELAIAHILTLYRKMHLLNPMAKEGVWDAWKYRHESYEIFGKTIGVVGAGAIGRAVIQRLRAFEPGKILYYDSFRHPPEKEKELGITHTSLENLLLKSDIVTLHLPLFKETRHLINKTNLALMKKTAILINTARGPIVDEEALVEAVSAGKIAGAGLDVFDPEPFVKGSKVLSLDNIVTTPHIGAATVDNFIRVITVCMDNILRCERGEEIRHVVNGVVLQKKK